MAARFASTTAAYEAGADALATIVSICAETGVRTRLWDRVDLALAGWWLNLDDELVAPLPVCVGGQHSRGPGLPDREAPDRFVESGNDFTRANGERERRPSLS